MDDKKILKLVDRKGDIDYEEQFETDIIAAIDNAYSHGVSRAIVITLLQVYHQMELQEIIDEIQS